MTPASLSRTAPRTSVPSGTLAVAEQLDTAFDELVAAQAPDPSGDAAARTAVLAIASALLGHLGVRKRTIIQPAPLARLADALIGEVASVQPADAAVALAALFERALGPVGKRDQGAVYTPVEIVDFMVVETIAARCADALGIAPALARQIAAGDASPLSEDQARALGAMLLELRVVDPAVGAGAFLIGAAQHLSSLSRALVDRGMTELAPLSTPAGALSHCCHGYELDADAVTIATAVLTLATHTSDLQAAPSVVTQRDPLLEGMDHPRAPRGWDVILMNPPYVGEKYVRARLGDSFADALREIDGFSGDLLSHFMIRALGALRAGGVVSAIVSDTAFTMETTSVLRREIIDRAVPLSIAWCRPFRTVAVQGGVITAARPPFRAGLPLEWLDAPAHTAITDVPRHRVSREVLRQLPGRQLYRPTEVACAILERWSSVEGLETAWHEVGARGKAQRRLQTPQREGAWILLGGAVRGGQGLATGDDRRFIGAIAGTDEAARSATRQRRLLEALRTEPDRKADWNVVREQLGAGHTLSDALAHLLRARQEKVDVLPERKPFMIVDPSQVRTEPLTPAEIRDGIASDRCWIPYETSGRSATQGGARWTRETPIVLDWSCEAVALLRERRKSGERRPVLRNEDLWFQGGVTHNRVTSQLRARMMPKHAIFSSESPVYIPLSEWLDSHALLALLNAPVVEFIVKTFLASRNHIEVGHMLRVPIPVLTASQSATLTRLGRDALTASRAARAQLPDVELELDRFTRELYGVGSSALDLAR
jgi:hypothetical protein